MPAVGSIVVRRHLGRELRALRERSRRTREDVAAAAIASVAKLARIEGGSTPVRPGDVRELCRLYGASQDTADTLAAMAQGANREEWWERLDVKAQRWFKVYLSLENVATRLCVFEPMVVHGLFQTAEYAREVERATLPDTTEADLDRYVAVRMQRQQRLFGRDESPLIEVVLGEPALASRVGSADLMAAQLARLQECAAMPTVDVRVLPLNTGPHPGYHGGFTLLAFDDPADLPVVYVESYDAARYLEAPAEVAEYRRRFEIVRAQSVSLQEFVA